MVRTYMIQGTGMNINLINELHIGLFNLYLVIHPGVYKIHYLGGVEADTPPPSKVNEQHIYIDFLNLYLVFIKGFIKYTIQGVE